jgi:putative ABC transport system permease protein
VRDELRSFWHRLVRRAGALRHDAVLDRDAQEEMRLHVELEAEDLARRDGLSARESRRRALVAFGGVERWREAHRDARGWRWLEDLVQDIRYAGRSLLRAPGFTVAAIAILGLGIGGAAAMFGAIDKVLLSRLPYPNDDELVQVFEQNSPSHRWAISTVDYQAVEQLSSTFSAVGAANFRLVPVTAGAEPAEMPVGLATPGFFRALGVHVATGRDLTSDDGKAGATPVALIGHALAVASLGGPAQAVGRAITVDGTTYTVVGVLAPGVRELTGLRAEVWPALQILPPERRGPFWLRLVARRAPGVTLDEAQAQLAALSTRIFPQWEASFQDRTARLTPVPLRRVVLGDSGKRLGIYTAAVVLVLLVALANIAGLLLVRSTGRRREIAVRTALGATRGRLSRMLVTESVVLASAGALLGVVIGAAGLRLLGRIAPDLPGIAEAHFGWRTLVAVLGLVIVAVIAIHPTAFRPDDGDALTLREGDRGSSGGRGVGARRAVLVAVEFALALPLLAGAGLLFNSVTRLERVNPGFDAGRVMSVAVRLPSARYPDDSARSAYWSTALQRVREVPGVIAAGVGAAMPPNDLNICCNNFDLLDKPAPPGSGQPSSPWTDVDEGYFAALGVPLLDGRLLNAGDSAAAPPVIVVSRSWARHFFPNASAVGRQLHSGGCNTCPLTTIVGVVGDVKYQGLGAEADVIYDAVNQGWPLWLNLFVRTRGAPSGTIAGVQAALRSVDPDIPLDDAAPMAERIAASTADPRLLTELMSAFAALALALAAVGVFGMLSYTVTARRREIGVRMALGARRGFVVGMITAQGMRQVVIGAAAGLVIALVATRALEATLYGVSTADPATLAAATLVLLGVAAAACWLAARRAARIDPLEAMRAE